MDVTGVSTRAIFWYVLVGAVGPLLMLLHWLRWKLREKNVIGTLQSDWEELGKDFERVFEQPKDQAPQPTARLLTYQAAHGLAEEITADPVDAYRTYLELAMNARAESHRTMYLAAAAAAGLLLLVLGMFTGEPTVAAAHPMIWWGLGALALSVSLSFLARFVDVLRLVGFVGDVGTAISQAEKDRIAKALYFVMRVTKQRRVLGAEVLFYEGLAFLVAGFLAVVLGLYLSIGPA